MPPTGWGKSSYRRRQLLTAARPTPAMRAMSAEVTVASSPLIAGLPVLPPARQMPDFLRWKQP
ncbi:hypothetical protein Sme01_06480 [Sphaerisporangium melleum]|uniref:Uncharacterized protein n=1 Tax=Sphaerisporangium melleum TaxID=321316 RepID=A0A917RMV8_9ACTN|nr:hypothetical protein GCM10007964_65330 [Sphaerisporangium melleum]GII68172.1 hypothetical protein Sme01_06480 [Sphaerisporangium melleum]